MIKCCIICGKGFAPDARTRRFQQACSKPSCRRARKRQADQRWCANNPGYASSRALKIKKWSQQYPCYWKHYRAAHPDYARRNRAQTRDRMRQSRLLFAKQDAIRQDPVGYLEDLRVMPLFAKQDAITLSIDGILTYLATRDLFAKPNAIAPVGATVASSTHERRTLG